MWNTSFILFLDKKTSHDLYELNDLARKWCDKVNSNVHSTTGEKPIDRLPLEGIRKLPSVPYYEENTIKAQRDGSVYFRGRVYRIDESLADYTGQVFDFEDTLFAKIVGTRDLPVYIRKRYSRTKQTVHGQKRRTHKASTKASSLEKWLPRLFGEVKMNWRACDARTRSNESV